MNHRTASPRKKLFAFIVSLAAVSAAQAATVTVTGTNVTLMSGTGNLRAFDDTASNGSVLKTQNNSPGSLGQFDPSLGVLTDATGTLTIVAATLTRAGSPGSAGFSYQWQLGGNSWSKSTSTTGTSLNLATPNFGSLSLVSSAANLNNFVGLGNIGQNSTNTQLSANRTGINLSGTSASVTPNPVLATESIVYTYSTHSNASFASGSDVNGLTIDFGQLDVGASADQGFSIFNLGGLGLTNFTLSYLSGDNLFDIAAGGPNGYNAHFAGQSPTALAGYDGTYRLTFTDSVVGLGQYASSSIGTNYIDLRMLASVAPAVAAVPEPETYGMMLAGLGLVGFMTKRRYQAEV